MDDLATCIMCGRKYRNCLSCKDKLKITPWKKFTDTVECWQVFVTLRDYHNHAISRAEAREQLAKIRYNKYDFSQANQRAIDEILADDMPAKIETTSIKETAPIEEHANNGVANGGVVNDIIAVNEALAAMEAATASAKESETESAKSESESESRRARRSGTAKKATATKTSNNNSNKNKTKNKNKKSSRTSAPSKKVTDSGTTNKEE